MLFLFLLCVGIAAVVGLGVQQVLKHKDMPERITWIEFGIGMAIIVCLLAPLTLFMGYKMAKANKVEYNEYWNGIETEAVWQRDTCSRDGSCRYEYQCDSYTVQVYHAGNGTRPGYYTTETRWHDCPYVTEEWNFYIKTTLGDFTIAEGRFADNPVAFRAGKPIPGNPRGIPDFWARAKARLDAKTPGPVTKRMTYDNYILASQNAIIKKHSADIATYKAAGLLPKVVSDVHDFYYAQKFYPVGLKYPVPEWEFAVNQLNAALGGNLQGDLHLVMVDGNKIENPDNYAIALGAYWQSKEIGKNALSKNGILVIIGSKDGVTVDWARAQTGMPVGNEHLMLDIQNGLQGKTITPQVIIGNPVSYTVAENGKTKIKVTNGTGVLEQALWGEHKFQRVCMTCKEENNVGYNYLKDEIQPSTGQKVWLAIILVFETLLVWTLFVFIGLPATKDKNDSNGSRGRHYDDGYYVGRLRR